MMAIRNILNVCPLIRNMVGGSRQLSLNCIQFSQYDDHAYSTPDKPAWKYLGNWQDPDVDMLEGLTDYQESKEDYKYVERILAICAPKCVPPYPTPPPNMERTPLPSGWIPPPTTAPKLPYFVERTKNHLFPVSFKLRFNGSQKVTTVRNVRGDIWAFATDLVKYLSQFPEDKAFTPRSQVIEYSQKVEIKGIWVEEIKKYLADSGF